MAKTDKASRNICVRLVGVNLSQTTTHIEAERDEFKHECLTMYTNGMGFRAIERVKKVHHTTIINWVKQVGENLPDAYLPEQVPQVGELDELQTFVGSKKNKLWLWTAPTHFRPGILGWAIGDLRSETDEAIVGGN